MLLAAPVSVELRFSVRLTSAAYTYVRAFVKEKGSSAWHDTRHHQQDALAEAASASSAAH